jgi:hypothetical protein
MSKSTETEETINDQVTDSVAQIQAMVNGSNTEFSHGVSQQITVHAVGLAMQNAVAQQQEQYILRNAIVTAAANAILESNPIEAITLAEKILSGDDVISTISGLKDLLNEADSTAKKTTNKRAPKPTKVSK